MKKLLYVVLVLLLLVGSAAAQSDVASQLVRAGINTVAAEIMADHLAVSTGTVAAAGSTHADAAAITKRATYVTASDDARGVKLPAAVTIGFTYDVFNTVASKNLKVYPSTGGQINAGGANVATTVYGKGAVRCLYGATDTWQCATLPTPGTKTIFVPAGIGRAGTTGGWTNTGTNMNEALLPQNQTTSTFTIPVNGLEVGDTIVSFQPVAQMESGGNAVSFTTATALRKLTNAAADPVDSSVQAISAISKTADYATSSTDSTALTTPDLVETGESFYFLVTGTTGASTDIRLLGFEVVVRRQ
jgi:hypothetical protein